MATTSKISLKLLVDENAKKVLFAEAGKDFVDFLFGLLKVPLGSIIGVLTKERMNDDSGSLVSVYKSVQNLDPSYLQTNQNKESLLKPKLASSSTITPPLLTNLLPQNQEPNNVGYNNNFGFGPSYVVAPIKEVGYVKGMVTYMVMDNLELKPMSTMSTISGITLLNEFHVKDVSKLRERTVQVDNQKALELIKALLDPNRETVLTDIFITKKIPPVPKKLEKEQEEKEDKRRYRLQAHLYTIIKVARNEDLLEQIGKDIYFDLVDHDKVRSFRIQKQMPFNLFKEEVAKEFGVPVQCQRFWIWAKRQNNTYRPRHPLTPQEEAQLVGQLREVSNKKQNAELKLFLEVEVGPDLIPAPLPEKTEHDFLLFFKFYDPEKEELRYVGRFFVKSYSTPIEILAKVNEMAGFAPDEEIEFYEEIKFYPCVMCEHLDKWTSFQLSQIEDGDIICFQKSSQPESHEVFRYPDVPSFLEYVHNRQDDEDRDASVIARHQISFFSPK